MLTDVVHGEDVRVIERGRRFRFLLESVQTVGVSGNGGGQDFDGNVTRQARIASSIDLSHAPCTQEGDNLIRAQASARLQRHGANIGIICRADAGPRP